MPLTFANCSADMRIVALITEAVPVERILTHIGDPAKPTPITPIHGPPDWDDGIEHLPGLQRDDPT